MYRYKARETTRRESEGERVRFEADRKRAIEAAAKELDEAKKAEADRTAFTLAEHGRELREARQKDEGHTPYIYIYI